MPLGFSFFFAPGTGVMEQFVIWETVLYQINLFESSRIVSRRYFGGGPSCLVTLIVSDFGRVIYLT